MTTCFDQPNVDFSHDVIFKLFIAQRRVVETPVYNRKAQSFVSDSTQHIKFDITITQKLFNHNAHNAERFS